MNCRPATHLLVAVFAGVLVAACQSAPLADGGDPSDRSGVVIDIPSAPFPLAIGSSASATSGTVRVTLAAVLEDSRCPRDVVCVWEGRATVLVRVDGAEPAPSTVELTLPGSPANPSSATVGSYVVTLHALDPYPVSTAQTDPAEYRATLSLESAP